MSQKPPRILRTPARRLKNPVSSSSGDSGSRNNVNSLGSSDIPDPRPSKPVGSPDTPVRPMYPIRSQDIPDPQPPMSVGSQNNPFRSMYPIGSQSTFCPQPRTHMPSAHQPSQDYTLPNLYSSSSEVPDLGNLFLSSEENKEEITLSSEINKFIIGQDATITVIINNVSSNSEKNAFYINALTYDKHRVVIKAYGHESDILEADVKADAVFRFANLKTKKVGNINNSDVFFDFLFAKDSKVNCVFENRISKIVEFNYVQSYIGKQIQITGTVSKAPEAKRNYYVLQLIDLHGVLLQVRISPLNFFVEAIKEGKSYSFLGIMRNYGDQLELEVKFPAITCIREI